MDFNFVVTASFFALLGYGLCYIALAYKENSACTKPLAKAETEVALRNDSEFEQNPLNIYHTL